MAVFRVALIGLNSLYGQASSLLLKLCPNIYNLRLYDENDTSAADDIRVINTPCKVEEYRGKNKLNDAIKGSDIVLIGDDVLSTPQTCFDVMAPKMQDYAKAISESSPNALIIVAASPVNKLVPVLSELLQENGYYDCNRVMGTTTSLNIRANCILASYVNTDPRKVFLPVVGGDSEDTIVPLFSQAKPHFNISEAVMKRLIEDIKQGSPLIYQAKGSTEALNKAHSTIKFLNSVIAGLRGEPNIMNIAFSKTTQVDGTEYFALPVLFGRFGIQARYGIPRILPFENDLIRESVFSLQQDTEFAKLFCKSRETAAETCSRNVAIRYRKSKEFEQFVNGLKMNLKETATEDKIANKIKPPKPIEVEYLSKNKPFDPKVFYLRHKSDNLVGKKIIPAYMRTGDSIMPVSLGYTLGNNNEITQFVPKSSSAETLTCEPAVCPDKPKIKEISYNSIASLVESLVKHTTEKMMKEQLKDESLKENIKKIENKKHKSRKQKNIRAKPDKSKTSLRKFDMLKLKSENVGNFKSSTNKVRNFPGKARILTKNKSIPVKHNKTDIGNRCDKPLEKVNIQKKIDDRTNTRKIKFPEKKLESIFRPTFNTFKERFDFKSDIRKVDHHNDLKQSDRKQANISLSNKKITETKHYNYYEGQRIFNCKPKSESSQFRNVPTSTTTDTPTTGDNENHKILAISKNILNQKIYTKSRDKEEYKKDSLESIKNEKLAHSTTKQENKNHVWDKYKTVFENNNCLLNKACNTTGPFIKIKEEKYMNNLLLENLNNSTKKENMHYDRIKKKSYELLVGRKSEKKLSENIGSLKSPFNNKSCKDTKNIVKNKLRGKYSANKGENDGISLINKTKIITGNAESKSNEEVQSICYNAFSNEITHINNTDERCDSKVISAIHNQSTGKSINIGNNPVVPCRKEIKSISEPKQEEKITNISFQENQSSINDNKDFNILMNTLDSDVFKCDDKGNTNRIIKDEAKKINATKNDSYEDQQMADGTASYPNNLTEKCNELMKSEIKREETPEVENSQTIHHTENPGPTEMTFEDVINEIKLAIQPSNQQNNSTDVSKPNKEEKFQSTPNFKEGKPVIENLPTSGGREPNEESHNFPQHKETNLKKESLVSSKNSVYEPIPEGNESVKNQIDSPVYKMNNVLRNISDKSNKSVNKSHQSKSCNKAKPCSPINPDNKKNKLSPTIPERFVTNKSIENKSNEKTNHHEGDSISYIKSLHCSSQSKANNKPKRKDAKEGGFKMSVMNLNDLGILDNSLKQKNACITNSIQVKKPLTPSSKYSKSFITSRYNKKKTVNKMHGYFSGQFGQKVEEINKREHSFNLRDKNGINNYFLLKDLKSKNKNKRHKLDNYDSVISLLKTNVCNEDPFMSIKDKEKNKINLANENLVKPDLIKTKKYITKNEPGSLLITHNSLYSPNCPFPGLKYYIDAKDKQTKSVSPTNKGDMIKVNEAMLSNLCRMYSKGSSEKNSSRQLNQKTHNFKLYSTSALPIKNKSPSCLCVEKRKTAKQVFLSRNEVTGAKLPKGFIKNQRITKILEKGLKKYNPQTSSKYSITETQAKEINASTARLVVERNSTKKGYHLPPPIIDNTTKIDENFFNSRFNSSYIERYLKTPPNHIQHQDLTQSKNYLKYRESPKGRRVADIFKINWLNSQNNQQKSEKSSVSRENDILVRGTCLDHVRNKFVSNKAAKHELSNDAYSDVQRTVVNTMEPSSLSNAFLQYTKDYVKCECPTNEKLPSIRQLHKCAFSSN